MSEKQAIRLFSKYAEEDNNLKIGDSVRVRDGWPSAGRRGVVSFVQSFAPIGIPSGRDIVGVRWVDDPSDSAIRMSNELAID